VLYILEVFETEVWTCEAEGCVERGEDRPAETMAGARLQRSAETLEEESCGDHEQTAECHLRHNQTGAQAAHRIRRPHAFALEHGRRVIKANLEERHEATRDGDAGARCACGNDAKAIRGEQKMLRPLSNPFEASPV
jgi:hypothetical protein